jgi:acyl carrier protein
MELAILSMDIEREFGFEIPESLDLAEMSFGDLYEVARNRSAAVSLHG